MIPSPELFVGALVSWLHAPHGGYGYIVPVNAEVKALNLGGTVAVVEVALRDGRKVRRRVGNERLAWRESAKRADGGSP